MKALILSDIHSNIYALETIWAQEQDCDVIYCAGDLVDYGPNPREVVDWVRSHKVICTQGNHDKWVVQNYHQGKILEKIHPDDRFWFHHNLSLLVEEDLAYLESLPVSITFQLDGIDYGMSHLYQKYDEIVSLHSFQEFKGTTFKGSKNPGFTRLILGHTHRQSIRYLSDSTLWLNPGSVAYRRPDDPDQTAHYATITDGKLALKRVPYDLGPLRRTIKGITLKESEMKVVEWFFCAAVVRVPSYSYNSTLRGVKLGASKSCIQVNPKLDFLIV